MWIFILIAFFVIVYLIDKRKEKTSSYDYKKSSYDYNKVTNNVNAYSNKVQNPTLGEEQIAIHNILEYTNDNVFVTGKAGTGKSFLLEYFVANTKKSVAVVAPTGVAALSIGGQTIHSFFKLPPEVLFPENIDIDNKTKEMLKHVDTLVIDEISMVRVDLMESINKKFQLARNNKLPFGGTQVIMFGDLYQLPPVVTDGELHRYFNHAYGSEFFFDAPVIKNNPLNIYELEHIYRQTDKEFIELLNAIRLGENTYNILDLLNSRYAKTIPSDIQCITLAPNNKTVERINSMRLESLPGNEKVYEAIIQGDLNSSLYPTEKKLRLKVGAQVMLLKNDIEKPPRWVNGTIGKVEKLFNDCVIVNINGVSHSINKATWLKYRYYYDEENRKLEKEVVSSFTQFPLRLAWAITIHKSQGQTFPVVAIDLEGGAFSAGQTYVALSRCVSMDGLYLNKKISTDDIIVDQRIIHFMKKAKTVRLALNNQAIYL